MQLNPYESPTGTDDTPRSPWRFRLPVIELLVIWAVVFVLLALCGPPQNELQRWFGRGVIITALVMTEVTTLILVVWSSLRIANFLGFNRE
jgi:antibiotic biosynthesis monooxygenase (ABM) superfamily enzyme